MELDCAALSSPCGGCDAPLERISHVGSGDLCSSPALPIGELYRQPKPVKEDSMAEMPNFTPDVEAAAQRIQQTSERVLALSKENGLVWLEA